MFGFIKRLFGRGDDEEMFAEIEAMLEREGGPRDQHYVFAHLMLRQLAIEEPLGILATLADEQRGPEFLKRLWDDVGEQVREDGPQPDIDFDPTAITCTRCKDYPTAIIRMPAPEATTECHMVGIVVVAKPPVDNPKKVKARYFTLEHGMQFGDIPERTVLCEWDRKGTHSNYGRWPAGRRAAFAEAIAKVSKRRRYATCRRSASIRFCRFRPGQDVGLISRCDFTFPG